MSWKHLKDETPKARKPHQCCLCERTIEVGEVHVKRTGVYDGEMNVNRMHSRCSAATAKWDDYDWENGDAREFREYLESVSEAKS